ncbi:hypothetical protein NA57DRAFT_80580 [Rhizodiscina lignyota]|uniref:Uncharacterized protein n=1 Tax=Rhizodiscina lignyota TaxID=1504668 RepID=A0A9P4M5U3_9PEZI|nr:hypothetical protein NA57DRAFT_80580 [Rhizodiscina lignyota]
MTPTRWAKVANYDYCACKLPSGDQGAQRRGLLDCQKPIPTTPPAKSASPTPSKPSKPSKKPSKTPKSASAPAPTGTGSCKATIIKTDSCLTAHTWNVDAAQVEAYLKQQLGKEPDVTINGLSVSGTGSIDIAGQNATFTYDGFKLDIDVGADGFDVPTSTVVNGKFEASIFTTAGGSGKGDFCLVVYAG